LCVKGIDFAFFYDFSVGFWNCSHNMFFLSLIYVFLYLLNY
jgi:hypothetical protein